mmetsp:Transcript_24830/g.54245  ORF Transcript_24830/g.54245 Transcript_24830/m.54245 type:complete len:365 (-) Transcript_24830:294-1388(-)
MEDRQPALERVLPVLAHLGSFAFRHKDSVNVRPEHARDGVDHATDGVPRARDHLGRACVAVAVARADDALVVDKELRVVVALLRLGPLVPARRAEQPAEHHLRHLALHRHRVLVQVHAAAIFAKRHAQYHERVAVPLVAGYLGRPLAHVEPLAAPFHPHWRALMRAHDAAREVVEAGGARGARVHRAARPALAHPREVALQELRLEEAARALGRRRLRRLEFELEPTLLRALRRKQRVELRFALGADRRELTRWRRRLDGASETLADDPVALINDSTTVAAIAIGTDAAIVDHAEHLNLALLRRAEKLHKLCVRDACLMGHAAYEEQHVRGCDVRHAQPLHGSVDLREREEAVAVRVEFEKRVV